MVESARVRRSPKFAVFLGLGAAFGLLAALILTFAFGGTADQSPNTGLEYSQVQVFGFVALICVPIGLAVGIVVALILDRVLARGAHDVQIEHEHIHTVD